MGTEATKVAIPLSTKIAVGVAAVAVVGAVGFGAYTLGNSNNSAPTSGVTYGSSMGVVTTQDELDAAMAAAAANAKNGSIALSYKNGAYSEDGLTFECDISNSPRNLYDMFITIFADAELTDQLFLSQLVPRGSGFTQITLDRALEQGSHKVYVVITQVGVDENGEEFIAGQLTHTMDFHVS